MQQIFTVDFHRMAWHHWWKHHLRVMLILWDYWLRLRHRLTDREKRYSCSYYQNAIQYHHNYYYCVTLPLAVLGDCVCLSTEWCNFSLYGSWAGQDWGGETTDRGQGSGQHTDKGIHLFHSHDRDRNNYYWYMVMYNYTHQKSLTTIVHSLFGYI